MRIRLTKDEARERPSGILSLAKKHRIDGQDKLGNPRFTVKDLYGFYARRWSPCCQYWEIPEPLDDINSRALTLFPDSVVAQKEIPGMSLPTRIFILFPYPTVKEVFNVGMKRTEGQRVSCYSDTYDDDHTDTGARIDGAFVKQHQNECSPINALDDSGRHFGFIAHRRVTGGWVDVPCDPDTCPFLVNKKKEKVCKQKGLLKYTLPWASDPAGVFWTSTGYWKSITNLYAKLQRSVREVNKHRPDGAAMLTLQDITAWLTVTPSKDSFLDGNGKESTATNYMLDLEFGNWYVEEVHGLMARESLKAIGGNVADPDFPEDSDDVDLDVITINAAPAPVPQKRKPVVTPPPVAAPVPVSGAFNKVKLKKAMEHAGRLQEFMDNQDTPEVLQGFWNDLTGQPSTPNGTPEKPDAKTVNAWMAAIEQSKDSHLLDQALAADEQGNWQKIQELFHTLRPVTAEDVQTAFA